MPAMPRQPITLEDLSRIMVVGDPQMSPDGADVLYAVKTTDVEKNKYFSHLWLAHVPPLPGKENHERPRQFTFGEVSDSSPRWQPAVPAGSPDGRQIAFIRTQDERSQIWVVASNGGEPRALTALPDGDIGELMWSPDGRSIAFAFRPAHEDWTKDAAKKREESRRSKPPRVITTVLYRLDGQGFQDERQHIWVCDVGTRTTRQLTRGDFDDGTSAWSPDSRTIAFTSNRVADPARHAYRNDIWLVSANSGGSTDSGRRAARRIATPIGTKSALVWSPDGEHIAYVGNEVGADPWLPLNRRLWIVPRTGAPSAGAGQSDARCLGGVLDRAVGDATLGDTRGEASTLPIWSANSRRLLFVVSDSGSSHLYSADVRTGKATKTMGGARDICGLTADAGCRRVALLVGEAMRPAEVFTAELADGSGASIEAKQLTDHNGPWLAGVRIGAPREFWLTQPDGTRVQGWVLRPPNVAATKKHPCLLYVHGGPHAQYGNAFFHELQYHAARGYVVVYGNPRGSSGRDTPFGACIHRDWGHVDYEDVMAIADHAESLPYVDKKRLAIAGGSYGGFMTNWAVGHTQRFRCAVTDRSISSFVSMAGTSDAPPPPRGYWTGVPFGDDLQLGWNMSPIRCVENVRTPMLIIHSEGDLRCPITQAEEWFTALKWLRQEAVFVRYPPETSHGLSRGGPIDLRYDRLKRIGEWLDEHCM
jgi:dipeptidyl aminopeptidase/acylaminoacyl peptidase